MGEDANNRNGRNGANCGLAVPLSDALHLPAAFLAQDFGILGDFLNPHGAQLAALRWNPQAADIADPPLRFLLQYWQSLCPASGGIPPANAISPLEMRPALGYILLIEALDEGWDGRFRLYGTKVAEMYGRDMTGRLLSEIDGGNYISQFFRALYRAVWFSRQPVFCHHEPPPRVSVRDWRRLLLPLAGPDGNVSRFLVGNVPGDWRPPALFGQAAAAARPR